MLCIAACICSARVGDGSAPLMLASLERPSSSGGRISARVPSLCPTREGAREDAEEVSGYALAVSRMTSLLKVLPLLVDGGRLEAEAEADVTGLEDSNGMGSLGAGR